MNQNSEDNNVSKNLSSALLKLVSALEWYEKNITPKIVKTVSIVADVFSRIDFDKIQKWANIFSNLSYMSLLKDLKLPLFLIDNSAMQKEIIDACEKTLDERKAVEIALKYCDSAFIDEILAYWNKCETISADRKNILQEALFLHNEKRYYASTSILMCQIYGIVTDMNKVAKKKGLILDDEDKKVVAEHFSIKEDNINSEKGLLAQMTTLPKEGNMVWIMIAEYIIKEILCSSDSKTRWATQPLRNKICHGSQLNFNTEEHSLKAVLVIDILIQLTEQLMEIEITE